MSKRFIDLSIVIEEGMTTFPVHWHPMVEITHLGRHGIEDRETRKIVLGTHTGTHLDAPRHFVPGGLTVDKLDLSTLVGEASVVDFSSRPPCHAVDKDELQAALAGRDTTRVIIRYDWDKHLGTNSYYSDHPFLLEDACEWLVEVGCRLIAMDSPMPDNPKNGRGTDNDSPNHKILLEAGVLIVEYLCNIAEIDSDQCELIVLPLKIIDGDGSPVRCIASVEDDNG